VTTAEPTPVSTQSRAKFSAKVPRSSCCSAIAARFARCPGPSAAAPALRASPTWAGPGLDQTAPVAAHRARHADDGAVDAARCQARPAEVRGERLVDGAARGLCRFLGQRDGCGGHDPAEDVDDPGLRCPGRHVDASGVGQSGHDAVRVRGLGGSPPSPRCVDGQAPPPAGAPCGPPSGAFRRAGAPPGFSATRKLSVSPRLTHLSQTRAHGSTREHLTWIIAVATDHGGPGGHYIG
jgi:hypothetical protein